MEDRQWLGVKELADTVGVSRQTLIYYDSIDLFKPEFIDTNGYRKYSTSQIMELREILFLKNNNVPLEVIKANIKKKSLDNIKKGLKASREKMLTDIESMNRKVEKINNRIYALERAGLELYTVSIPMIKYFPKRMLFMMPWGTTFMTRSKLYQTFMNIRKELGTGGGFEESRIFQMILDGEHFSRKKIWKMRTGWKKQVDLFICRRTQKLI